MFQVGDILYQRYRLLEPLGKTAVGHQTWLADDLFSPIDFYAEQKKQLPWLKWFYNLNQVFRSKIYEKVTVKLLAFNPQLSWEQFKLFEREARILQGLDHPFIPRYRNYFEVPKEAGNGVPWFGLVEDYIAGKSLQDLLEQGERFSEAKIRKIAIKILKILIYLHELNPPVLHRDIKPSNLILGEDNNIYLIDFGAVQDQNSVTNISFTVVGTSGYTPLEQFWGKAVFSSDLYALGATLIHLLTGISPTDLHNQDYQIEFKDEGKINPDFKAWLTTLTEIKLSKRYQTAREALQDLQTGKIAQKAKSKNSLIQSYRKHELKTKVKLNKTEQSLQIVIPSSQLKLIGKLLKIETNLVNNKLDFNKIIPLMTVSGLFLVPFSLILTGIIVKNPSFIMASLEIMGGMSFTLVLILLFLYIISSMSSKTCLIFDKETLKIQEKILGFEYYQEQESKNNILGIFIHELCHRYNVTINTRKVIYNLASKLTEEEALWLTQEIEDWLN
ncbi:serine/threonine protein kinase [Crocosphaera chwakensis]|uniref:Serine/threonine protein kinase n=1 Tax=Crocosphaera chwakensis CCY0110 TaxID=391612 RepID=A3IUB9_9CHRO|nr:serine/threonine-protein kinase [Crocosphaera chwakensis]EAZ89900.1 serine/threonine protein kinase [Crocosphaera chwakensis CCY0110]